MFLEGIEVPIVSIQTQSAPNSPTVATIQIPPLAEVTRLHPRTTVHVFFLDLYKESPAMVAIDSDSAYQAGDNPDAPRTENEVTVVGEDSGISGSQRDSASSQWKLLFGGEVVGWSWNKTPTERSVVLQCE